MSLTPRVALIIDASLENRELYRSYLTRDCEYSYTFLEADLGQQGLDLWQNYQPDIVLLNYPLPDLDGLEFLKQAYLLNRRPWLPLIWLTEEGQEAMAMQAIKAGAQDYLIKAHMTPEYLHLAIDRTLENVRLRTQLQELTTQGEGRRLEVELQESKELLRFALDSARMGTWEWDLQTGNVIWSDNVEALFGLEPGEFNGFYETFVARIHPDDRTRVIAAIETAVATGAPYNLEFRIIYPNGTIGWALSQGQILYDPNGQPIRMTGIDTDITERKRSEEALQSANQQVIKVLETMTDGFIAVDRNWKVTYVNQHTAHTSGRSASELLGQIFWEAWPGSVGTRIEQEYRRAMAELTPVHFETYYDPYDIWVEVDGYPSDEGLVIYYRDITARKQTEIALQEQKEQIRLATEGSNLGMWFWDLIHDQLVWTDRCKALFGLPPELPMTYAVFLNAVHPEDRERVDATVRRSLENKTDYDIEMRTVWPDGTVYWIVSKGRGYYDPQGNALRISGTAQDITERKQTEAILRQSEERYRFLAELIPQLVWTADTTGALLDVNQRWLEFTGLNLDQVNATGWAHVVHPEDVPVLTQQWNLAVQKGCAYQAEGRMRRADGVYRWHLHQAIPQKDDRGQLLKWFGTATDIDAQKQLEMERDRLLQLEQSARSEAERANHIKDDFLAVLSHELRTPLNPILGWTQLLKIHTFDRPKTLEALSTIERNAKLQAQLIDDLLDIAKILRGKLSLKAMPVNLAFVIESAIETVQSEADAKSIVIHPVLAQVGKVFGDAARLQQIIWNLLSNAIKFTPQQGQINIYLERVGNQAQITVSDTGKGILPSFLPYIFDSFRQEDASTTRRYGGLGLGLTIVRQLVESHGGTITADSPGEGLGATFTIHLPLLNTQVAPTKTMQLDQEEPNLTGIRVLTVDDEPDTRILISIMLSKFGAEVMSVASGVEALACIASFQPNILVSDIGMPEMDGYTLVRQIRSLPAEQGGKIPAIALTAYVLDEDRQRALTHGYQRQVNKPFEIDVLVEAIQSLITGEV